MSDTSLSHENILAVCYDFDHTLSPNDMQAQGYIEDLGFENDEFWAETGALAKEAQMDTNLAYMYLMCRYAPHKVTRELLRAYGSRVELFPGVTDWFSRLNEYGARKNLRVEHYIISSGLTEMLEGTSIYPEFKRVYANSFYFDAEGTAVWPAMVVNYTNKTQFLFRISKGVLDVYDNDVNNFFTPEQIRVPFHNFVYIGDSSTDIPCMKLVTSYGGCSVGVHDGDTAKVKQLMEERRINFFARADYREGSELDGIMHDIIDAVAAGSRLRRRVLSCRREARGTAD